MLWTSKQDICYFINMETPKLPKGVSFDPSRRIRKYKAVRKLNGKLKALGYYRTPEEAHQAFLAAGEQIKE
jgi:hypothetical protein